MRPVLIVLLTAMLAWAVWTFFRDPAPQPTSGVPEPIEDEAEEAVDPATAKADLTTGTIVVTVRTPEGTVPKDAWAGYRYAGEDRLRPVNRGGSAQFTDAPLGQVTAVARAPGYVEQTQRRAVIAGVRQDVVLVLRPEAHGNKPRNP
jgi:hypothetical protein